MLDERRKQRDLKRHVQQTISDARSRFEAGAHQDALASLREFSPAHELVSQALQELQNQLEAIQRKISAENERLEELRRAEEAEKKAREDKERRDRERREEEARILADARAAEEQRRQQEKEAQRLAEEAQRLAEEQRKEQERRKEEERRRKEERRKKEEEEAQRRAAEQERIKKEDEARRLAAEAQRQKEADEVERRKQAEEARWRKEAEEARRKEAEEARQRKEAEEARRLTEAQAASAAASTPIATDENVQFTVFRRSAIQPEHWYPLLCFAHLAERRPDAPDEPDPIEVVQEQARQIWARTSVSSGRRPKTADTLSPAKASCASYPGSMEWHSIRPNADSCGLKASTAKTSGCVRTNQWTGVSLAAPSRFSMEVSCSPRCSSVSG